MSHGWTPTAFGPDDSAVEVRFLVGFALKRADDPFYQVPKSEKAADAYFARRADAYQQWTADFAPMVARCLGRGRGADGALTLNFLYQDLFFGAREQTLAEYATLQILATMNGAMAGHAPEQLSAIIAPTDIDDEMLLRVQLAAGATVLATADKPLDLTADLEVEVDDLRDALASIGLADISVALRFDADGNAVDVRPLG